MWFLRYMRRMPWTDRNVNEAVLKKKKKQMESVNCLEKLDVDTRKVLVSL